MRKAARVIVVHNQSVLLMKRNKFGSEYYCLVGGGIDPGETADQAALREAKEETSLILANPRLVYVEEAGDPYGTQYIFLCDYQDGEVRIHPSSIEAELNKAGQNTFETLWLPISKFAHLPFRSETLHQEILQALVNGFPLEAKLLHSQAEIRYTKQKKKED